MGLKSIIRLLAVLFWTFGALQVARADCVDYLDLGPVPCHHNGCSSDYESLTCTWGCTSGICYPQGGSGLCCGVRYYTAAIYPDGGDCHGSNCQPSKFRHHAAAKIDLLQGEHRGTLLPLPQQFPRLLLVPDRCAHIYGIIIEEPKTAGGM